MTAPPEQRTQSQRPPVGAPPDWMPSARTIGVLLVFVFCLLAILFQSRWAPSIEPAAEEASIVVAATPVPSVTVTEHHDIPGIIDDPTEAAELDMRPLFPDNRIVAFYGHPNDPSMGILGQFSMPELLDQLLDQAAAYTSADPDTNVLPAFEIIGSVAQPEPGPDGNFILQTDPAIIQQYIEFTQENDILLIIDIQLGRTSIQDEMDILEPYLKEPNVHLAIDPEFAVDEDQIPGVDFGSVDAADINYASERLTAIIAENNLPPKALIVHRFTDGMVTNIKKVQETENVQFVLDFDGYGDPLSKTDGYDIFVKKSKVPWGGIKLFYDQDRPLLQPIDVVALDPPPVFVMYQ